IRSEVAEDANVILGSAFDDALEGKLRISVVAAGVGMRSAEVGALPAKPAVAEPAQDDSFVAPVVVTSYRDTEDDVDETAKEMPMAVSSEDQVEPQAPETAESSSVEEETVMVDVPPEADKSPIETASEEPQAGFSSLFGWRRSSGADNAETTDEPEKTIVSSPDDHPEPAPFDDADLEIPAFLRRSANH
ncbi:MAG: cell division protein FtsZ, partial [Pseudomonadota bacterium]